MGRGNARAVAFRCDMLVMREEAESGAGKVGEMIWRPMSCEDEDDFEALKRKTWSPEEDFAEDEPVELWRVDAEGPPRVTSGYARGGKVLKVRLAKEDPDLLKEEKVMTRAGRKRGWRGRHWSQHGGNQQTIRGSEAILIPFPP